mmetsp:Transcript_56778/g.134025  ORF Transcript_56778/g.134025 Transcript_56778/m.134025 type:complete len:241 (-) Transcript_56778:111-833(-)
MRAQRCSSILPPKTAMRVWQVSSCNRGRTWRRGIRKDARRCTWPRSGAHGVVRGIIRRWRSFSWEQGRTKKRRTTTERRRCSGQRVGGSWRCSISFSSRVLTSHPRTTGGAQHCIGPRACLLCIRLSSWWMMPGWRGSCWRWAQTWRRRTMQGGRRCILPRRTGESRWREGSWMRGRTWLPRTMPATLRRTSLALAVTIRCMRGCCARGDTLRSRWGFMIAWGGVAAALCITLTSSWCRW